VNLFCSSVIFIVCYLYLVSYFQLEMSLQPNSPPLTFDPSYASAADVEASKMTFTPDMLPQGRFVLKFRKISALLCMLEHKCMQYYIVFLPPLKQLDS